MISGAPNRDTIADTLNRLENSAIFRKADRQRRLLRYLLERAGAPNGPGVKEYVVGLEVFDRPPSFDPATDSIVRVEMRKLRNNLERYYETEGRGDAVRVTIPKGTYSAIIEEQAPPPVVSASSDSRPRDRKSGMILAAGSSAIAAGLIAVAAWTMTSSHSGKRDAGAVAILPFENLGGSGAEQRFADTLTAELIDRFGKLPAMRVESRGTVLQFKNMAGNPARLHSELGVDSVVEGNVRIAGNHARIGAQFVDAETGRVLLSKTFDIEIRDPRMGANEAADAIMGTIRFQRPNADEKRLAFRYSGAPDARELYLHGMYGFNRVSRSGLEESIAAFRRAIELDPRYAPAYSAMADAYVALAIYGQLAPNEAIPRARAAAQTALQLDPALADPHAALGFAAAVYDWDWAKARAEFEQSIELNPGCAHCHAWYALYVLGPSGDESGGLAQVEKALESDPIDITFRAFKAAVPYYAGDYAKAVVAGEQAVSRDPNSIVGRIYFGAALRTAGRVGDAIEQDAKAAELFRANPIVLRNLGEAYVSAGRLEAAGAILTQLEQRAVHEYVSPLAVADLHAVLGHHKEALQWLARAVTSRDVYLIFMRSAAIYEVLHGDPEFQSTWRRIDPRRRI